MTRPRDGIPWRIAFISDPHGGPVGLSKVISDLETGEPVDEVLVGGDLAQGGAQPAEVIDEIRKRWWPAVRANGDDLFVLIPHGPPASEPLSHGQARPGGLPATGAIH